MFQYIRFGLLDFLTVKNVKTVIIFMWHRSPLNWSVKQNKTGIFMIINTSRVSKQI